MIILTVNTGSSSIRLAAFSLVNDRPEAIASVHHRTMEAGDEKLLNEFIHDNKISSVSAVAHRVVHGGQRFSETCLVNDEVEKEIDLLSALAPLHNPVALKWIRICREHFGDNVPHVAVFDTAFYSQLPEAAKMYALPADLCRQHEVRRYGFHGIAHSAMLKRWKEIRPELKEGGRVISLQLGAGCSMTAVKEGRAVDTSMGFSPLEGLVMATRSGDLDPGLVTYLLNAAGFTPPDLDKLLNNASGLLGVSGISGDMRVLLESNSREARLAVELYCYRARKYIGAYLAVLGGCDAVLFGGGVGENAPVIRKRILEGMTWCGIYLDDRMNSDTIGSEGRISSSSSNIDVRVIPVDEAAVLASEARELLEG